MTTHPSQSVPVIRVSDCFFEYPHHSVLMGLNFSVHPGEFAAIIGSNGAGKSTLLKLLLGELTPSKGEIALFGQSIPTFRQWPLVGYLPQNGAALVQGFPATALELVTAGLYHTMPFFSLPKRCHRQQAMDTLEMLGVADLAHHQLQSLSGGQLQRVLLARSLVGQCRLLILDEPEAGIDPQAGDVLYQLLTQLNQQQGLTIVMVTHDVSRASQVAGRVLCLEHGTLLELDHCLLQQELQHRHHHPPYEGCQ